MSHFQLTVRSGPDAGTVHILTGDLLTIGRYAGNAVVILDQQVSRIHARLSRSGEGYTIEDLGSSNGLFVNGERVAQPVALASGDRIGLGTSVLLAYEIVAGSDTAKPAPVPLSRPVIDRESEAAKTVSDTSGTVYMQKIDLHLPQQKKESFVDRLRGLLGGKKSN